MGMTIATTGTKEPGCESYLVYGGPYREIVPRMAADGYRAVEMHILDSREIDREELWGLLRKHGLRLTSIGTGSVYDRRHYNLADKDAETRKKTIAHLAEHMITAEPDHGVVIVGLVAGRCSDAGSRKLQQQYLTESLHALDHLAGQHEVWIGLELMNRFESDILTSTNEGITYLECEQFTRVRLHLDSVHMNIEEQDIGAAIRRAGKWIGHVHLADNDRCYPGHAHINFREILQALHEVGYKGALALETSAWPDSHTSAVRSLRYLQFLLDEIEGKIVGGEGENGKEAL